MIFVYKWGTLPKQKHFPVFRKDHLQTQRGSGRNSRGLPSHVLLGRVHHRRALTFHRPALCASSVGSSYFSPGSWPNGANALSPLNHLSAHLRLSPLPTSYCINLALPRFRKVGSLITFPVQVLISAHHVVLPLANQPRTFVGEYLSALLSTRVSRAAPTRLGRFIGVLVLLCFGITRELP